MSASDKAKHLQCVFLIFPGGLHIIKLLMIIWVLTANKPILFMKHGLRIGINTWVNHKSKGSTLLSKVVI